MHSDQSGFESHRRQFLWKNVGVVFPSAGLSPGRVWQSLFRDWFLKIQRQRRLAQMVEHQTSNLGVTGSTPVPTPKFRLVTESPEDATAFSHSSLKKAGVDLICQTETAQDHSYAARKPCDSVCSQLTVLSARRDAMQCVDTASRWQQKKGSKAARCTTANSEMISQQQPCCRRAPHCCPQTLKRTPRIVRVIE